MREGWTYKKLGEVCDFQGGSQPPKNEWSKEPQVGYVRMLQIRDFTQSATDYIEFVKISKSLKYCKEDDILIGRYGASVGKILTGLSGAYNVAIIKTIPSEIVNKNYIKFYFLSPFFQHNLLIASQQRAAQAGFSKEDIVDFKFPCPPLSEQQRIVSELDLLSGIIEKKKAQLKEYDQLAQSIFYDMFGDPVENEKGWEVKKLGEVCEYAKTRVRSEAISTNNYVGVDNLLQNCQGKTIATKVPAALRLTEYWKGDVLIGNIRPYLKKNWLATERGGCNGDVLAIRRQDAYKKAINTMFLFKCLSTDRFFDFAMQYVKGEKMPRGDKKEIMKYLIYLPPLPLQQSFASKIEAIEHQKALIQQSITETETLFNSRMDYYFN